MNSHQAKQISLPKLMSRLGYEPTSIKKGGNEYWYHSPFRKEKDASFHTSFIGGKWIWNDFGDSGGTVIDFVMRHEGLNSVRDSLKFLEATYAAKTSNYPPQSSNKPQQSTLFSSHQQSPPQEAAKISENDHRELEFIKAHQIQNPIIYAYLLKRTIPQSLADKYLREVKYRNRKTNKQFFAFGMRNQSGGYEVRAATDDYIFKSALIKRDISVFTGQQKESTVVNIFEGMLDFLSLLVMLNVSNLSGDTIVMHSLSSYERTLTAIKSMKYQTINGFLDNNRAGQETTNRFNQELGDKFNSQSTLFAPYEDVNDALMANAIPDFYKK